jgi:hypothetical protein
MVAGEGAGLRGGGCATRTSIAPICRRGGSGFDGLPNAGKAAGIGSNGTIVSGACAGAFGRSADGADVVRADLSPKADVVEDVALLGDHFDEG